MLELDQHFSYKYFLKIALVREISPNFSGGFGPYRHEWVKKLSNYLLP